MSLRPPFFVVLLCLLTGLAQAQPVPTGALERAQQARTMTELLGALGVTNPEPGKRVLLEVPDIAEADKPITLKVTSRMVGTDLVLVLLERGGSPFVKLEEFSPGVDRGLTAEIKLSQGNRVRAVVRSGGKYYHVSREIKVATRGWSGS